MVYMYVYFLDISFLSDRYCFQIFSPSLCLGFHSHNSILNFKSPDKAHFIIFFILLKLWLWCCIWDFPPINFGEIINHYHFKYFSYPYYCFPLFLNFIYPYVKWYNGPYFSCVFFFLNSFFSFVFCLDNFY